MLSSKLSETNSPIQPIDSSTSQHIKSYYSSRTEALLGILLNNLANDKHWRKDPFATANIIVPNSGMQRYLELKIAEHFGIFTQVNLLFPSQYLRQCYEQTLGEIHLPAHWDSRALAFRILALWQDKPVENHTLANLLEKYTTPKQRYGLATQIAQLFSSYLNERPEMISAWQNQKIVHGHLSTHEKWQMQLFNQLQLGQFSREQLQQQFHQTLSQRATNLPAVHIFGFHSLPPLQLSDFAVLSNYTDIFTYVFNPSLAYWQDIVPTAIKTKREITAEDEAELMTVGNPLLASWGQAGKYLIEQLNTQQREPIAIDEVIDFKQDNLLHWVQHDIQQLQGEVVEKNAITAEFSEKVEREIQEKDFSISLHAAASPRREVEILYDYLSELFSQYRHSEETDNDGVQNDGTQNDGTKNTEKQINPADILVMVPDLRDYAPHIQAVFGSHPQIIPFSLANQKAGSADSQVQAFLSLIAVIDSDFSAQALFDAISETQIRQHFKLSLSELETMRYWLIKSRFAQRFYDDNHGQSGSLEKLLDSLLLASIGGDDCQVVFNETARQAFTYYQDGQRETLNQFATIISALSTLNHIKKQNHTLSQWQVIFTQLANRFLGEESRIHQRIEHWYNSLSEQLSDETEKSHYQQTAFDYETVKTDLVNLLENEDLHGPFLSGGVSFCAMVPMRSIPAKMICLLGLNSHFPATDRKNPLDLRQLRPLWSDKKTNKEHKYFFLETLMATRQKLYLCYVGQDEKTGEEKPASILVDELWATVGKSFPEYAEKAKFTYPIQGYLTSKNQVSYQPLYQAKNPEDLDSFQVISPEEKQSENADTAIPNQLKASELVNALLEPFTFYLKKRLNSLPISQDENTLLSHDFISADSGLDKWQYKNALLNQALFHQEAVSQLQQHNYYAPTPVSQALLNDYQAEITPLITALSPLVEQGTQPLSQFVSHSVNEQTYHLLLDLPHYGSQGIWQYSFSATQAKYYLRAWVNHILLNLTPGKISYHSQLFTLDKGKVKHYQLKPMSKAQAQLALKQIIQLYEQFFGQPHAIKLSYEKSKLVYQKQDYPLYPNLMAIAVDSDNDVLTQQLVAINQLIADIVTEHLEQSSGEPS